MFLSTHHIRLRCLNFMQHTGGEFCVGCLIFHIVGHPPSAMWLKVMHFSPVLDETLKISRRLAWRGGKRVLCTGFANSCCSDSKLIQKNEHGRRVRPVCHCCVCTPICCKSKTLCLQQRDETSLLELKKHLVHMFRQGSIFGKLRQNLPKSN